MIITITKEDGQVVYDTTMIEDAQARANADISISKIGTLNVVLEALSFASGTHQHNLEQLLQNAEEVVVETPEGEESEGDTEEVAEEDSTDES